MIPVQPLPLTHSWPLFEHGQHFNLGFVHGGESSISIGSIQLPVDALLLAERGIGTWECDLSDNSLTWSAGVYDLFGLQRDAPVTRAEAVALYCPDSLGAMERLRAYAIKHKRGFTLDAELQPRHGRRRWMRLMAAPICVDGQVVRLHGLKQDVSRDYV
jgi:PAS domain-containing protein